MSNIFRAIFPRPAPKGRLSDVQERSSIVSEKAVADFMRVCDDTNILSKSPFADDFAKEEKARNEYLDSIGYPKQLRD